MRYKITFSYDGSDFHGFQKQKGKRTVQEEIEKVLSSVNNSPVKITGAGRTDAKVNALGQVAHFDFKKEITLYKLKSALNSYLPNDIYIIKVEEISDTFHARYMVKSKTYEYKVSTLEYNPLLRNQVYQYGKPLNINKMKESIKYFIGVHDFTSFSSAQDKREDKVRELTDAKIIFKNGIITITFKAKGFLKYQVRNMVGMLIKIGEGKYEPYDVVKILSQKDRTKASITAPAEGLTLKKIEY